MDPILKVSNLSKSFKNSSGFFFKKTFKKEILKDINFNASSGESIALLGRNGCGKTTLLKIISGVLSSDESSIKEDFNMYIDSSLVSMISSNDRAFFWRLSVEENLKFFCNLSKKNSEKKIKEVLCLLEISDKLKSPFMSLSQGERKKISIARALLNETKILLLDEITNSLDLSAKKIVINILKNLLKTDHLKLIIFATHSLDEVIKLSNRILYIKNKTIYEDKKINDNTLISDLELLF